MKRPPARDLLDRLCAGPGETDPLLRAVVIVAHPDDEVVGAGARLPRLRAATFVHVTDGAPRDLRDARLAGFDTREAYARARREELHSALGRAGIEPEQARMLGIADQEAAFHLVELTEAVRSLLRTLRPDVVLTHPYEGGHPDHDATAFAVHAACRLLEASGEEPPAVLELTSYHNRGGSMATYAFLPYENRRVVTRILSDEERAFKQRLVACYETQTPMLRHFPIEVERFRVAPVYDFAEPPHEGELFYEFFDWGMTGPQWLELARSALARLGLASPVTGAQAHG